ncbi:MAG TPA: hypothetical protein VK034_32045 [Enhygromyxa sp.]|nr:hypothetical protein [Enhygromyxa sp.]
MFTFTKLSSDGNQAIGELTLEGKTYSAVSGGHGRGELPEGTYRVDVRGAVEGGHLGAAFKAGGVGFFIPIEHISDSTRTGLGIHPDGNVPGTEGCIGVSATDSRRFLNAWKAMSIAKRPSTLTVIG